MKKVVLLIIVVILIASQGCTSIRYYSQVTRGHLDLMSRRVPIEEVLEDPATEETLKARLLKVLEARAFAVDELKLPDNGSYRSYADVGRPFVLWNVFATKEFSTEATTWCYLFVGCLGYRGYYDEQKANEVAADLNADGFDAFVGGVPAYSTLGRFDDPVVNTMLRRGDVELAGLLFHELTHQVVYRESDSEFSESLASFVEAEGVRRWILEKGGDVPGDTVALAQVREEEFVALVTRARDRLTQLYASSKSEHEMRVAKAQEFERLQSEYVALRESWDGYAGYDGWFDRDLNNAHLVSISTYNRLVPAFEQLLRDSNGDFDTFFKRSEELSELEPEELTPIMDELLERAAK